MPTGKPRWMQPKTGDSKYPNVTDAEVVDFYQRGARRYITSGSTANHVNAFIASLEAMLARIPAGRENDPIPWAVSEVGWTTDAHTRIYTYHLKHTNSNDVLNLFEVSEPTHCEYLLG